MESGRFAMPVQHFATRLSPSQNAPLPAILQTRHTPLNPLRATRHGDGPPKPRVHHARPGSCPAPSPAEKATKNARHPTESDGKSPAMNPPRARFFKLSSNTQHHGRHEILPPR